MGVWADFCYLCFSEAAFVNTFDIADAIINILGRALGDHFDGAVMYVADMACEVMAVGIIQSGEAKAHSLDATCENYLY